MNNLNQFLEFNFKKFISGKEFIYVSSEPWIEYSLIDDNTKKELGSKVNLLIMKDKTEYKPNSKGEVKTNSKIMMTVKVRQPISTFESWQEDDVVKFVCFEKAVAYSNNKSGFVNQLSVICDIKNVTHPEFDYLKSDEPKK